MRHATKALFAAVTLATAGLASADYTVSMTTIDARGQKTPIGDVKISAAGTGVKLVTNLKGLPPGSHGFHVHQKASCDPAEKDNKMEPGEAAGGHYDPQKTAKHTGPAGTGHLGDLPVLVVDATGASTQTLLAPRLSLAELKGHSLMIHAGGDNLTDQPANGGGGARIACGIIS